jgi:hypothetical protein
MRNSYDGIVFAPDCDDPVLIGNRRNMWRGFPVEAEPGSWRLMQRHIWRVLAKKDKEAFCYIVRWLAWMVQHLGSPAEAVLVLKGEEGAGKGILGRAMLQILGMYGMPVSDQNHLTGAFSGHLHYCIFLFLDEAFWAGSVKSEGRLKSLVTEDMITIEPKYVQAFPVKNMLHIMMASNNDWVVPAGHGARRYAVFDVSDERVGDFAYFKALRQELESGGLEAMLYDLLALELGDWHPRNIPKNQALLEQKQHSLRGLDAWIEGILQAGSLPSPVKGYPNRALSAVLLETAKEHDRYTNETALANKLKSVFGKDVFGKDVMKPFNKDGARGWIFPTLVDSRKAWERRNGGTWNWHRDVREWEERVSMLDSPSR